MRHVPMTLQRDAIGYIGDRCSLPSYLTGMPDHIGDRNIGASSFSRDIVPVAGKRKLGTTRTRLPFASALMLMLIPILMTWRSAMPGRQPVWLDRGALVHRRCGAERHTERARREPVRRPPIFSVVIFSMHTRGVNGCGDTREQKRDATETRYSRGLWEHNLSGIPTAFARWIIDYWPFV